MASQQHPSSSSNAISYGQPCNLDLGHPIFISHSGVDKDFVDELYYDLRDSGYDPFFDRESLPKAHIVTMNNILIEAKKCKLAVFVISEEFFSRNKNPLLELVACVEAEVEHVLPVFLGLTVKEFKDERRRARWYEEWKKWATQDDNLNVVSEWQKALKILGDSNGVVYKGGRQTKREFRHVVIEEIQNLIRPLIRIDDSNVQGRDRLSQEVDAMFAEAQEGSCAAGARVVGLHGMGGVGKTTLCKTLLNFYDSEFRGRVHHIQLDSQIDNYGSAQLNRLKICLRKLIRGPLQNSSIIDELDTIQKARPMVERYMQKKVFLAIDNVQPSEASKDEVSSYLTWNFPSGSKVLVTSRSDRILTNLCQCLLIKPMPSLKEEEAVQIFCKKLGILDQSVDREILKRCVNHCYFQKRDGVEIFHFHPLALVALASWLQKVDPHPSRWASRLESLPASRKVDKVFDERLFGVLRSGFDTLTDMEKLVYLDLALFLPSFEFSDSYELFSWKKREFVEASCHENTNLSLYLYVSALASGVVDRELAVDLQPFLQSSLFNEKGEYLKYKEDLQLEWLCYVHNTSREAIENTVEELRRLSIISGEYKFGLHDLYHELARKIGKEDGRLLFLEGERFAKVDDVLQRIEQQQEHKKQKVRRLGLVDCRFREEAKDVQVLPLISKVEVLKVFYVSGLNVMDLGGGRGQLRSLESRGPHSFIGLETHPTLNYVTLWDLEIAIGEMAQRFFGVFGGRGIFTSPTVHDTIPSVASLQELSIRSCTKLESLVGLGTLNSLNKLSLEFCPKLQKLDGTFTTLASLQRLSIDRCDVLCSLTGLGKLKSLKEISLKFCPKLHKLDGSIANLVSLEKLSIVQCDDLHSLVGLGRLRSLKELSLEFCPKLHVANSTIAKLHDSLEKLSILECDNLQDVSCCNCFNFRTSLGWSRFIDVYDTLVNKTGIF